MLFQASYIYCALSYFFIKYTKLLKSRHVVYFDQLSVAARTTKLVEKLFAFLSLFCSLQTFSSDFSPEIKNFYNQQQVLEVVLIKYNLNEQKKVEKCFDQLLGAHSTRKLVKIHNIYTCLPLLKSCQLFNSDLLARTSCLQMYFDSVYPPQDP